MSKLGFYIYWYWEFFVYVVFLLGNFKVMVCIIGSLLIDFLVIL